MCAKREANSTDEIEITHEMIEEGVAALASRYGEVGDDVVAYAVFVAMIRACPRFKRFRVVECQ